MERQIYIIEFNRYGETHRVRYCTNSKDSAIKWFKENFNYKIEDIYLQ